MGRKTQTFECYICNKTYNRNGDSIYHFEEEINSEELCSVCDNCAEAIIAKLGPLPDEFDLTVRE